jgi:hypothetical protein
MKASIIGDFASSNMSLTLTTIGFFSCSTMALRAASLSLQYSYSGIGPWPSGVYEKVLNLNFMYLLNLPLPDRFQEL